MVDDKGLTYTLEAMMASLIIVLSVLFMFSSPPQLEPSENVKDVAFGCLRDQDRHGLLREYAVNNQTVAINTSLSECFSFLYNYSVEVCRKSCVTSAAVFTNATVNTAKYYISSFNTSDPLVVKLHVWRTSA